uniref:Swt1 family HEPN domain-containing protein n=1 Tax=Lysinibacillus sp. FSL L8-0126 TaxID=2921515 RepID=UPI00406C1570
MKEAYGCLYKIENAIRAYIEHKMEKEYGVHWFHIAPRKVLKRPPSKPFNSLSFHEYSRIYLRTYDVFQELPEEFFSYLESLYPLRNKVAHCFPLTETEYVYLVKIADFFTNHLLFERIPNSLYKI